MNHQHVWIIDSPNGPTSAGVCKICNEVRNDFANSVGPEYNPWNWDRRKQQAIELGTEMRGAVPWE